MTASRGPFCLHWTFTYNNPTDDYKDDRVTELLLPHVTYAVFQLEKGENGTPHYQGYCCFKTKKRLTTLTKILPCHWSSMYEHSTPAQASAYCQKDEGRIDGPWIIGTLPVTKGKRTDLDQFSRDAIKLNDRELFEAYPSHMLRYSTHVDRLRIKVSEPPSDLKGRCGVWIYGPTHTGKSEKARSYDGSHYDKLCNKWWDGYIGQPNVIVDDLDLSHDWMSQNLKRWADKYPFMAETKGGMLNIRPERVIVTSNYSIEEVFVRYPKDIAPLRDRFKVIETQVNPLLMKKK